MNRSSPMMAQYKAVKDQHPDKLVMFQVGDFYELFFEDAIVASRQMEIALTSRDSGSEDPIPLAGVPIHSADTYLNKLLGKGYKVVICEQVENAAQSKGLVRREITRIITPGTITDPEMLEESCNNYLVAVVGERDNYYGLAAVDISTGDFQITEHSGEGAWEAIADELQRLQPPELICTEPETEKRCRRLLEKAKSSLVDVYQSGSDRSWARQAISDQWDEETWDNLNLDGHPLAAMAAAAALTYLQLLKQLPAGKGGHFHRLELYFPGRSMVIDSITGRNLELTRSLREGGREGSLLALLDRCKTAMGRRLLRRRLEQPLLDRNQIEARLDAVGEFLHKPLPRRDLRKTMQEIFDLERFCSRLAYEKVNARDLVALKNTLRRSLGIKNLLSTFESGLLKEISSFLPAFTELIDLIDSALVEEPPLALKEGGLFKAGYDREVDRLKKLSSEGEQMLLDFEKNERRRTGIKSLRISYNRNFGYYIEVTRTNLNLVPEDYHRKQTLVNAERFTCEELYRLEEQISGAREKLAALEYELFEKLRSGVAASGSALLQASHQLARLDFVQAMAEVADRQKYCRPHFTDNGLITIKQARHPVVEYLAGERFVANDLVMDQKQVLLLITGPNMAGKSTYIRSAALIAIMAQIGSFVPAEKAELFIFDRLFARVGAGDDLSRGQSTFMVEMQETAVILKEATAKSLIILDEIGRGTSTYDGMSIARSVLEYICTKLGAKTLFSTHYHELTNLEGDLPGVKNYTIAVKEKGREVIFLRQVVPGRADKSYGINVARLAGVPLEVLARAEAILRDLELAASSNAEHQLSLLPLVTAPLSDHRPEREVADQLKELDLNRITPLEALQAIFELQQKLFAAEERPAEKDLI